MIFERLLVFDDRIPGSGSWNMAMDEALGESITLPVLRVYGWTEITASFGYFQKIAAMRKLRPDVPLVRRWTGGGLVDHGRDWTYSLILPAQHVLARCSRTESYGAIHGAIRKLLDQGGGSGHELAVSETGGGEGCFNRPVQGDILENGQKIAGAAQRRTRQFLVHQGSLQNTAARTWNANDLAAVLAERWEIFSPSEQTIERAKGLSEARYSTVEWLEKF